MLYLTTIAMIALAFALGMVFTKWRNVRDQGKRILTQARTMVDDQLTELERVQEALRKKTLKDQEKLEHDINTIDSIPYDDADLSRKI